MIILITGTAQGIGKAIAQEFLNKGHEVNGFDIKDSSINHPFYTHYKVDISQKDKLPDIEDVNILINNAGVQNANDIEINLKALINMVFKIRSILS